MGSTETRSRRPVSSALKQLSRDPRQRMEGHFCLGGWEGVKGDASGKVTFQPLSDR